MIYIVLSALCISACTTTTMEDIVREVEPEKPSAVHHYYSYKAGEVINAGKLGYENRNDFTPGSTCVYGDTLFIANTQKDHYSVELYSLSAHKKIGSLNKWKYKDEDQTFQNYVEAISVSDGKLYLANIGSCIDIFDIKTLNFITRMGTRNYGERNTQFLHTHAMAIVGDYMIVRMKNRLQVMFQSDAKPEKYQNVTFYSRGLANGFDTNNGFYSHQMAIDSMGTVFLADYGQYGNRKIHVIDTCLIKKGDNMVMTTDQTLLLNFYPTGIALYKKLMYISASDGSIRIYDREKKSFIQTYKAIAGYIFKAAQKMTVNRDRLWVTDTSTKEVVGIDIFQNDIEEYE